MIDWSHQDGAWKILKINDDFSVRAAEKPDRGAVAMFDSFSVVRGDDLGFVVGEIEKKLRSLSAELSKRYSPFVLRWHVVSEKRGCEARFDVPDDHPMRAWRLLARSYEYEVELHRNARYGLFPATTLSGNKRAAESELRSLGLEFRVEDVDE